MKEFIVFRLWLPLSRFYNFLLLSVFPAIYFFYNFFFVKTKIYKYLSSYYSHGQDFFEISFSITAIVLYIFFRYKFIKSVYGEQTPKIYADDEEIVIPGIFFKDGGERIWKLNTLKKAKLFYELSRGGGKTYMGLELSTEYDKVYLSVFRADAVGIYKFLKEKGISHEEVLTNKTGYAVLGISVMAILIMIVYFVYLR